ncbi:MAG: nucleoside-diphosphate sugar epimerase/dehydratase [bacterium]|nr:nucleoside-diphosphate sugar epimerase/dehydratase [bacterium]
MVQNRIYLPKEVKKKQVLIYGAGVAGKLILEEIRRYQEKNYEVGGFLDDDKKKIAALVEGVEVLGGLDYLEKTKTEKPAVEEILIAIPSAPAKTIRKIVQGCEKVGLDYKILPGIYDIITGKRKVSPVREVKIEDILGREPVKVSFEKISKFLNAKKVLIFGAGGSIGSEMVRQIANFKPKKIILFDQNESELYDLHMELLALGKEEQVLPVMGDIRVFSEVQEVFEKYKPEIVFHAAAYKHVPLMEAFPAAAVETNVRGVLNILRANDEHPGQSFVFVSTDKAVYPENVMGLTKRIGELLTLDREKRNKKTKLCAVRFGNVLGSRGSVVPLFLKQIALGGPVTVTDPKVERYFMTIPEAAQLVLQAAATSQGGEIFMLEMGEKIKIVDLAKEVIRLAGFEPEKDIEIKFVGLRPGEKLTETLYKDDEKKVGTEHEKISRVYSTEKEDIEEFAEELLLISRQGSREKIIAKLKEIK